MERKYVHGYSDIEVKRLVDQAQTLADIFHHDSIFPSGDKILEAGCGVGAQTITLAKKNPRSRFTSIDISPDSIITAIEQTANLRISNVKFKVGDIYNLPFKDETFDHTFVCFVQEHLHDPIKAIQNLSDVTNSGGSLTFIEGDHESTFFYPDGKYARQNIDCLVEIQKSMGGNALIGRQLYPLLKECGFSNITVSPRFVYVDSSKPELVEGFTKNTYIAMVEGVREAVLEKKMVTAKDWDKGMEELYRTAAENGTFCYTFFKAVVIKQ